VVACPPALPPPTKDYVAPAANLVEAGRKVTLVESVHRTHGQMYCLDGRRSNVLANQRRLWWERGSRRRDGFGGRRCRTVPAAHRSCVYAASASGRDGWQPVARGEPVVFDVPWVDDGSYRGRHVAEPWSMD
jgi:hypothetical protein